MTDDPLRNRDYSTTSSRDNLSDSSIPQSASLIALFRATEASVQIDPATLQHRQELIDTGKATPGYAHYTSKVPPQSRAFELRHANHPQTPPLTPMSVRRFRGYYDQWRGLLHGWDDDGGGFTSLTEMKEAKSRNKTTPVERVTLSEGQVVCSETNADLPSKQQEH